MPSFTVGGIDIEANPVFDGFSEKVRRGIDEAEAGAELHVEVTGDLSPEFRRDLLAKVRSATAGVTGEVLVSGKLIAGFKSDIASKAKAAVAGFEVAVDVRGALVKDFKADVAAKAREAVAGLEVAVDVRGVLAKDFKADVTTKAKSAVDGVTLSIEARPNLATGFKADLRTKSKAAGDGIYVDIEARAKLSSTFRSTLRDQAKAASDGLAPITVTADPRLSTDFRSKLRALAKDQAGSFPVTVEITTENATTIRAKLRDAIQAAAQGLTVKVAIEPLIGDFREKLATETKALSLGEGTSVSVGADMSRFADEVKAKAIEATKAAGAFAKVPVTIASSGFEKGLGLLTSGLSKVKSLAKDAVLGFGAIGAAALVAGASQVKTAASLEAERNSYKLLLQSATQGNAIFSQVLTIAKQTPFQVPDLTPLAKNLVAIHTSIGTGFPVKNVIPALQAITDIGSELNVSSVKLQNVGLQLTQIAGRGKITGDNLRALSKDLPGFSAVKAISTQLNESVADTQRDITSGAVSSTVAINALIKGMQKFPGAAGAAAQIAKSTFQGALSNLPDIIRIDFFQAFSDQLPKLTAIIGPNGPLVNTLDTSVKAIAEPFTELASSVLEFAADAAKVLGPVMVPVVEAFQTAAKAAAPLLPVVGELGHLLGQLGAAVGPNIVALGTSLGGALLTGLREAEPLVHNLGFGLGSLIDAFDNLLPALTPLIPELVLLGTTVFGTIASVLTAVTPTLTAIVPILGQLGVVVGSVVSAIGPTAAPVLAGLLTGIANLAGSLLPLLASFGNVIGGAVVRLAPILPVLGTLLGQLGAAAIEVLGPAFTGLASAAQGLLPALIPIVNAVLKLAPSIGGLFTALYGAIGPLLPVLGQFIAAIGPGLAPIISTLATIAPLLGGAFGGLLQAVEPLLVPLGKLIAALGAGLAQVGVAGAGGLGRLVPSFTVLLNVITPLVPIITSFLTVLIEGASRLLAIPGVIEAIAIALTAIYVGGKLLDAAEWLATVPVKFQQFKTSVISTGTEMSNLGDSFDKAGVRAEVLGVTAASVTGAISGYFATASNNIAVKVTSIVGAIGSIGTAFAVGGVPGGVIATVATGIGAVLGAIQSNADKAKASLAAIGVEAQTLQQSFGASGISTPVERASGLLKAFQSDLTSANKDTVTGAKSFFGLLGANAADAADALAKSRTTYSQYVTTLKANDLEKIFDGQATTVKRFASVLNSVSLPDLAVNLTLGGKVQFDSLGDSMQVTGAKLRNLQLQFSQTGNLTQFKQGLEAAGLKQSSMNTLLDAYKSKVDGAITATAGYQYALQLSPAAQKALNDQTLLNKIIEANKTDAQKAADAFTNYGNAISTATTDFQNYLTLAQGNKLTVTQGALGAIALAGNLTDIKQQTTSGQLKGPQGLLQSQEAILQAQQDQQSVLTTLAVQSGGNYAKYLVLAQGYVNQIAGDIKASHPSFTAAAAAALASKIVVPATPVEFKTEINTSGLKAQVAAVQKDQQPILTVSAELDKVKAQQQVSDFLAYLRGHPGAVKVTSDTTSVAGQITNLQNFISTHYGVSFGDRSVPTPYQLHVEANVTAALQQLEAVHLYLSALQKQAQDLLIVQTVAANAATPNAIPSFVAPIPGNADGAIVTKKMLSWLAEDGPEVVIPLTKPARAAELLQKSGLVAAGPVTRSKAGVPEPNYFLLHHNLLTPAHQEALTGIAATPPGAQDFFKVLAGMTAAQRRAFLLSLGGSAAALVHHGSTAHPSAATIAKQQALAGIAGLEATAPGSADFFKLLASLTAAQRKRLLANLASTIGLNTTLQPGGFPTLPTNDNAYPYFSGVHDLGLASSASVTALFRQGTQVAVGAPTAATTALGGIANIVAAIPQAAAFFKVLAGMTDSQRRKWLSSLGVTGLGVSANEFVIARRAGGSPYTTGIPAYHDGGIAVAPHVAVVGDRADGPEIIAPVGDPARIVELLRETGAADRVAELMRPVGRLSPEAFERAGKVADALPPAAVATLERQPQAQAIDAAMDRFATLAAGIVQAAADGRPLVGEYIDQRTGAAAADDDFMGFVRKLRELQYLLG